MVEHQLHSEWQYDILQEDTDLHGTTDHATRQQMGIWATSSHERSQQGDSLPPVIFNIIMDHLLRSLPQECGAIFNNTTVRAMAFSDDLVLLADSPTSLQHLLDHTASYLKDCVQMLNNTITHRCHLWRFKYKGRQWSMSEPPSPSRVNQYEHLAVRHPRSTWELNLRTKDCRSLITSIITWP